MTNLHKEIEKEMNKEHKPEDGLVREFNKTELLEFATRIEKEARDEAFTAMDQGATCCKDKHQTFYGAIIKSPQWQAWYKEQTKRFSELKLNKKNNKYDGEPTFDIDESVGIGAIGDRHLAEFFKFVGQEAYDKGFEKGVAIGAKRGMEYAKKLDKFIEKEAYENALMDFNKHAEGIRKNEREQVLDEISKIPEDRGLYCARVKEFLTKERKDSDD